ncbi:MAG: translation initiation factor IF-3 [Gammaproteobacteria bacterium]|nr:translation initiation factor IF-3 [Gammaproteobacteria bacterium]MBQ08265.1 translation initiation factor IF-3 [Gammaproteobacteria bacterium]MDP6147398.1 translation initiation factor IF-3 [Gammaproteobacteria bacterium]HJN01194.1 translation initiation factor IF-3 [Gammaproteobacteria bacterium]
MAAKKRIRKNGQIRASEIRLIDEEGNQLGILPINEAIEMAAAKGLDVVEVSPNTEPPVCKILDHGKYLFEQKKKSQGAKKKQKTIQVKEIKFRPLIEKGDYEVKVNKIRDFIDQGNKVKISLRYRGREMRHVELGHDLLKRVLTDIEEVSSVEQEVQFEGRQLITVVAPKNN